MRTIRALDVFLSPRLSESAIAAHLQRLGFRHAEDAVRHARLLAESLPVREALGALAAPLLHALQGAPDPDAALVGFSRFLTARHAAAPLLRRFRDEPRVLHLLVQIVGTSPFLAEILARRPESFEWLIAEVQRPSPDALQADAVRDLSGPDEALDAIKTFKQRHVLRLAALDILGRATLQDTTAGLSALADLVVDRALSLVVRGRLAAEGLERVPGRFAVIGMGKLGGRELNYSSDIDLIYVYEPDDEEAPRVHMFFERLARMLTTALSEHTQEGYLYRVDLRLRPMGRGGNITHSLQQIREYYATWAVTLERFALIKARAIGGDAALGQRFLDAVEPFVYRRYLDNAALEEMYQHKAVIDRAISRAEGDRNVKLGRGGIREVELFVQVLQLTYGARHPALKQGSTLAALEALERGGFISSTVRRALTDAYVFLRTLEHRLQIVEDRQTHSLPAAADADAAAGDADVIARRMGFKTFGEMHAAMDEHRARVHEVYTELFGRRRGADSFPARQFFRMLGDEAPRDEVTSDLGAMGFGDPGAALAAIQALGQHATFTSAPTTTRNLFANLLGAAVARVVRCGRPETVLVRLEQLASQTGGLALLGRSLVEDETLRAVLLDVLDSGELLAGRLIRDPELLDALVQPIPSVDGLGRSLDVKLAAMERADPDARLDAVRRFKRHEEFKILVGWLATESLDDLQHRLTLLADYCVSRSAEWLAPVPIDSREASWAIVALGKLGGMELGVHADLDLVIVYDDPRDPNDVLLRWQGFVEQLQRFLSQPTGEGVAYRIDTRLRPEGTKGPLAIPLAGLVRYFEERAEPWERLAWTRAQIVAGSPGLSRSIERAANTFIYGPWDRRLPGVMRRIRSRMERTSSDKRGAMLDFKVGRGGLADIDFLVELVQIREGRTKCEFRTPGTRRFLASRPSTRYIRPTEYAELHESHRFLRTVEMLARMDEDISTNAIKDDAAAVEPLGRRMRLAEPSGSRLLTAYREVTGRVRSRYTDVLARL